MSPASQGETLLRLVDVDRLLMQMQKQLQALPQREKLVELAETQAQLADKAEQVAKLRLRQEMSIKALEEEDQILQEKMVETQRQIEENSSKYKEVVLLTTEFDNLSKRAEKIAFEVGELKGGIDKIDSVEQQLAERTALMQARQSELEQSLISNTDRIEEQTAKLYKQREKLVAMLPVSIVSRYDRQRALKQGLGAAALEGTICGACHIELTEGQLDKARREADEAGIGTCPSCLRLLVIS